MILAALLDAGCPAGAVEEALQACGVRVAVSTVEVRRAGLRAALLRVESASPGPGTFTQLLDAVAGAALPARVREPALRVLTGLGEAEAALHGIAPERLHLHELGSLDTLVDVVGVSAALAALEVDEVLASPLPAAPGHVDTAHGRLPLPAPATLTLLAGAAAPLLPGLAGVEQVTPTGAALLAGLARFAPPAMRLRRVGCGAGTRDDAGRPNVLRCWLGESLGAGPTEVPAGFDDDAVELQTNLDDASPALVAGLAARCLEAGALDAWIAAVTMKKGRPGHVLHALVPRGGAEAVAALLLAQSPTLGVRCTPAPRMVAARDGVELDTSLGRVRVKRKLIGGVAVDARPELDDCERIAADTGLSLDEVVERLHAAARAALVGPTAGPAEVPS